MSFSMINNSADKLNPHREKAAELLRKGIFILIETMMPFQNPDDVKYEPVRGSEKTIPFLR
jgi:hypothetical protein